MHAGHMPLHGQAMQPGAGCGPLPQAWAAHLAARPNPGHAKHSVQRCAAGGFSGKGSPAGAAGQDAAVTKGYLSWAAEAGIQFTKVTQAQFGELRGAAAVADLAPGEPLVTVPRAAALVVIPQERCPHPDFVDPGCWKEVPWYVKMALLLLRERAQGRASRVWGYISQLPESIDTPVRWGEAELAELQYQPLIKEVRAQQRAWRQYYERAAAALQGGATLSYEDFLWAAENVRSRAFSGPYTGTAVGDKLRTFGAVAAAGGAYAAWAHMPLQQALNGGIAALMFNVIYDVLLSQKLKWYAMCPVVDAFNHRSEAESEVAFEYFKDAFALSTPAAHAAGEQVFISYGPQSNDSLLQYYGFTERGNPSDTYALQAALPGGQTAQVVITGKGSFAAEGLAAARAAMPGTDEGAVTAALLAACESELAALPTALADDERLLQTPHLMAPRARMAAAFRLEKKRLLQRAVARGAKRAAKLGATAA